MDRDRAMAAAAEINEMWKERMEVLPPGVLTVIHPPTNAEVAAVIERFRQ
jgi:hypothetical protein